MLSTSVAKNRFLPFFEAFASSSSSRARLVVLAAGGGAALVFGMGVRGPELIWVVSIAIVSSVTSIDLLAIRPESMKAYPRWLEERDEHRGAGR
jgi:hypothetical protein